MIDVSTAVTVLSPAGSVLVLGWWLRGRFEAVDNRSEARWIEHESRDQARHEDNLNRFADIRVALTSLGWRGGGSR